jgi:hypothetical protein
VSRQIFLSRQIFVLRYVFLPRHADPCPEDSCDNTGAFAPSDRTCIAKEDGKAKVAGPFPLIPA